MNSPVPARVRDLQELGSVLKGFAGSCRLQELGSKISMISWPIIEMVVVFGLRTSLKKTEIRAQFFPVIVGLKSIATFLALHFFPDFR